MSCSRTWVSICSRSGSESTRTALPPSVDFEPRRGPSVDGVEVVADDDELARLVTELDAVVLADAIARDGHALAVHTYVAVADQLARLVPARSPARPEDDVVEAGLEHPKQVLAGDAGLPVGLLVHVAELRLEHAVDTAGLLLLAKLGVVLGGLAHAVAPVLSRRVRASLDRAADRLALRALQEELDLLPPAEAADRSGVSSHCRSPLDPAPLLRAASVVGDRRDVFDPGDLDARARKRADGRLTPRPWTADENVDPADAVLHRAACALLGRHLRRERRRLARALESDVAGATPRR